jgi:4,5-dihydroxyphthalate decarboxylase
VSVRHESERSLDQLLRAGEIDAVVAPQAPPSFAAGDGVRRLFPDYRKVESEYFAKTRLFPIMHTVVLRRDFHREHPWVAASLFRAFDEARTAAIGRLAQREPLPVSLPWMQSELDETIEIMGPDFWPYGVERNQGVLEAACRYAWEQGLCARAVKVEELFDPGVVGLESSGIL